jgi:hypothetical protein
MLSIQIQDGGHGLKSILVLREQGPTINLRLCGAISLRLSTYLFGLCPWLLMRKQASLARRLHFGTTVAAPIVPRVFHVRSNSI